MALEQGPSADCQSYDKLPSYGKPATARRERRRTYALERLTAELIFGVDGVVLR
jgi:hypothetical protein